MPSVGSTEDLISRIRYAINQGKKPIAFVAGSGLTRGTVPGVEQLVRSMRSALQDESDAARFDREVSDNDWGGRYQQVADFLVRNRDQDLLNRLIRLAVLRACTSLSQHERRHLVDDEGSLCTLETEGSWSLDPGVAALGELLAGLPTDVRGPVITTNFDPLIEVSVRQAGGSPVTQHFDQDGTLRASDDNGTIDVAHVHGFWRRGDTLHTIHQLTASRPQLDGSLRELLRGHVVVVIGYGGWADAFSNSLLARAREHQTLGMDLLWCSYQALTSEDFASGLFGALSVGNHSTFYAPVDLNHALPSLLDQVDAAPRGARQPELRGWTNVTETFLSGRAEACDDLEAHRAKFFDGHEPDWAIAVDELVPRLSFARQLGSALAEVKSPHVSARIAIGVGLMGEGKSLALRQCAADLARCDEDVRVYWREPGGQLRSEMVLALPKREGVRYVLATDDGDLLIDDLRSTCRELDKRGRDDVTFAAVAQERDWRNAGGFARLSAVTRTVRAAPLSLEDATAVVGAWSSLGESGLGNLVSVDPSDRPAVVHAAAADAASGAPESLMGAMLELRYGDALVSRVEDLLGRLDNSGSIGTLSLTQAFLLIAQMHVAGRSAHGRQTAITERLLAEACGVDSAGVEYLVLEPLGHEAAISRHSADVWVRHEAIARAAVKASRRRNRDEIPRALRTLVAAAVRLSPPAGRQEDDLYAAAYIARSLKVADQSIAAAEAAVEAQPKRLSYLASLVTAYRVHGQPDKALTTAQGAWTDRNSMIDREDGGEAALLTAWATACGTSGDAAANVLLDAKCLEIHGTGPLPQHALLGMAVALTDLQRQTGREVLTRGLAGVVTLLNRASLRKRESAWARQHEATCRRLGIEVPIDEPWQAIQMAVDDVTRSRDGWAEPLRTMVVDLTGAD
jgi:hypothetical protein